ncbi:MAG: hypothetical protein O2857_16480, partial [Planctomycetota bacterium]|nr:hypothetical protein [Planctomycetota bacterium]
KPAPPDVEKPGPMPKPEPMPKPDPMPKPPPPDVEKPDHVPAVPLLMKSAFSFAEKIAKELAGEGESTVSVLA